METDKNDRKTKILPNSSAKMQINHLEISNRISVANIKLIEFGTAEMQHMNLGPAQTSNITYVERNTHLSRLPDGLIAQLVEHCTGIEEVMGSNHVQA